MEKNVVWDRTEWVRRGALVSLALSAGVVLVNCGGTSELRKRRADDGTGAATDAGPGGSGGSSFETGGSHGGGSGGGGSGGDGSVVSVTGGVVGSASGGVGGSGVGGIGGSGVGGIGGSGVGGIGGDGTGGIGTGGIGTGGDGTGGTGGDETGGTGGTGGGGTGGTGGGGTGGTGGMDQGESIFLSEGANSLSDAAFFDHPWPSDVRRDGNGFLVLEGYPNPFDNALIATYKTLMAGRLDGFSPAAAGYVRFTVPLDSGTLPATVAASTASNSNVQLIDITPDSPEYGERKPITLSFYANASTYLPENTLAFAPAFGQPLRPYTTYAFVVTESVLDQAGLPLIPGPDLQEYLDGNVPSWAYMYAAAISELAAMNIDDILQLAVFTTPDPTREAFALRDATIEDFESPSVSGYVAEEQVAGVYDVYEGEYGPSPDFQFGTPPFVEPTSGGDVRYDSDGKPIVQREFDLRFALGVPDATECPPPSQGYPIVLVAHGTGGDYRSAFNTNAEATMFAEQCLATLSIDQIFHGTRPGAELDSADLLYFNLQNPLASRTNGPQSAVDFVQLARLVTEGTLKVPASTSRTGKAIKFDPDRVLFFGHSQGGLNGPIALAADDQYRGGVFSGAAATITLALLDKKEPYDFRALLAGLLGLTNAAELDEFHPALSLAQTIADPADGIHYARAIVREPRAGFAAKSLFMTEGVRADGSGDSYAPPRGIESLAAAVGLPVRLPQIHASNFGEWAGLSPLTVPSGGVSGNLAGGAASGVLAQYDADGATDGHFVAYQVVEAREDLAVFLRSLADEPAGRVPE